MREPSVMPDRVACVTGAARGIGLATARRFAEAGFAVAMLDRDEAELEIAVHKVASLGARALGMRCDVAEYSQCEHAVGRVRGEFGGIDVLVNNAGVTQISPFLETDLSAYRFVMDVNFFGAVHCTKAALATLIERRGHIIAVSSVAGFAPLLARTGYCASKHALHGFFDTLREELRPQGVSVTLVCPSFVHTGLAGASSGTSPAGKHPRATFGRLMTPEEVASAIYAAARSRKALVLPSATARLSYYTARFVPGFYRWVMRRRFAAAMRSDVS